MQHSFRRPLFAGKIVYSLAHANWYKVQVDGTGASIGATMGTDSGSGPVGPRPTHTLPPDTPVLLWLPPGRLHGIIICSYAVPQHDGRLVVPDFVSQGSQSGISREKAYTDVFKSLYREGGVHNFSGGRPLDSTNLDWGRITETGTAVHLDAFMAFMRSSEACGIWFHYWDNHCRLVGLQFDHETGAHAEHARDDEGETRYQHHGFTYPWERGGQYVDGSPLHAAISDEATQFEKPRGKWDLGEGDEDVQPIPRWQEDGGYMGQGRHRMLMIPAKTSGKRHYKDSGTSEPDMGVFRESVGLDGTWAVEAAKQIHICKHVLIPVPKEMRKPEDQQSGDDARKNNYKFSGKFGGGDTHKVGDIQVSEGELKHIIQVSALWDILAYNYNWKPLHPYHYHHEDYQVAQESEIKNTPRGGAPNKAQDFLDFGELAGKMYMSYPSPKKVKVDDRYGDVEFYQRDAGFSVNPDGSVVLYDGYGSQIVLSAGNIRIECPGDIQLFSGKSVIALAGDDLCLRARNSADLTAGKKDLTLKAERNARLLGGNQETGGVLIESKAPSFIADFDNKIGEDIITGGIIFKAKDSAVVTWAGDIYLRTGGGPLRNGQIVLDASKGNDQVVFKGNIIAGFAKSSFDLWVGPTDDNSEVTATYNFTQSGAIVDKSLIVGGQACILGSVLINGGVLNRDGYASVNNNQAIGDADGGKLAEAAAECKDAIKTAKDAGKDDHQAVFVDRLYQEKQPGNNTTILQAEFSYRDDKGQQYNSSDFKLDESKWMRMVRLSQGSGGSPWSDEFKVLYQGEEQLPYPSKTKWDDEPTLKQLEQYEMWDGPNGYAKDRSGPYEEPKIAGFTQTTPSSGFKVIAT